MVPLMIEYRHGNLLESGAEALVNTVNEVGVMGKGVALLFRDAYPANTEAYQEAVRAGDVHVGRMFVTEHRSPAGPKWIINFPTKKHWRNPSKLEWVRDGLRDLVRVITEKKIRSVALPPVGCGSGGLEWAVVKREIEGELGGLNDIDILVFEPTDSSPVAPARAGLDALTPAGALIVELVRRYAILGLDCTNLEVQKLAWFLDRAVQTLRLPDLLDLRFEAKKYGPYADRLRHLLDSLDGSYLHCEKRLSFAGPLDLMWFDDGRRQAVASFLRSERAARYLPALERVTSVIDGFESPLGMELLATVDWLLAHDAVAPNRAAVKEALRHWPGGKAAAARKLRLFDDRRLDLALKRLVPMQPSSNP
jgi:O-acetyl-ADP-ribose deacetylase (regulator of RNase III)